jgi:hypothetical protein
VDHRKRFVARAEAGRGWRVWDKQQKRWWGRVFARQPDAVLAELNGPKRPERLVELMRSAKR